MSHYFTKNSNLTSNRKEISFRFFDILLTLKTDEGIFSKEHVDPGSNLLLQVVKNYDLQGVICDCGCGYGVVGITLKKLFPKCDVFGFDPNDRAVELAKENAVLNDVNVDFYEKDFLDRVCDAFIINPPIRAGKKVIYSLFYQAGQYLQTNGRMFVVMRKSHGVESAMKYCKEIFKSVSLLKKDKGYYVFLAEK